MKERKSASKSHDLSLSMLYIFAISSFLFYILFIPSHIRQSNNAQPLDQKLLPIRQDWLSEATPTFCDELKQYPQPNAPDCKQKKNNVTCDANRHQFFSQDGEDYYLYTRHFSYLNRPGVYVDVAANDAVQISNIYFMDRCLGWHGICAEANAKYFEKLFRERACFLVPTCISDTEGKVVRFGMRSASGGIVDTYKGDSTILENGAVERLRCTSLEQTFRRVGLKKIDYLSLDVEGHELMVLKGVDWEAVHISVITVELSSQNREEIVTFLQEKGFRSIDSGSYEVNGMKTFYMNDPVFVHESQIFGRPN